MGQRINRPRSGTHTGMFLGALVVILAALFIPGWVGAFLVLLVMAVLITWLRGTWPRLAMPERVIRIAVLLVLLGLAVVKIR